MTAPGPGNPYVGTRPYNAGEMLYGRARERRDLLNLLISKRIVLLYSPSGAGKTSLIQAGLGPELTSREFQVLPVMRVRRQPRMDPGSPALNRYIWSALLDLEEPLAQRKTPGECAGLSLAAYLADREQRLDQKAEPQPGDTLSEPAHGKPSPVLIFDQFEEILTVDPTDREAKLEFFRWIATALADPACWALFAMREEFLGALEPYLHEIPSRLNATFRLDLLGPEAAVEAIQGPARDAGAVFSDEAAAALVEDLRMARIQGPDGALIDAPGTVVEPLQLQLVCLRLWERLGLSAKTGERKIVLADLEQIAAREKTGHVDRTLGEYYDEKVAVAAAGTGVEERLIREWFDRHLITESGVRGQVMMGQEQAEGLPNTAIDELVKAHLVRRERRHGITWFELTHDRLIRPVREANRTWYEENLSLLQRQAYRWRSEREEGRQALHLLRGEDLVKAETWAGAHPDRMSPDDWKFLEACRTARDRDEQQWKEAQHRREVAVKRRHIRILSALVGVVAVIAGVAAWQWVAANRNAGTAADRLLAVRALTLLDQQFDLGLLLAVEAYQRSKSLEARSALLAGLAKRQPPDECSPQPQSSIISAAFSPDGKMIATLGDAGKCQLWDAARRKQLREIGAAANSAGGVAFSPNGEWLATGSPGGRVLLFEVFGEKSAQLDTGGTDAVWSVAFSSDGRRLAAGRLDGSIVVWSPKDHAVGVPAWHQPDTLAQRRVPKAHLRGVYSVRFSPDSRMLASGNADGTVLLWALPEMTVRHVLRGHRGLVESVAFHPTEPLLASTSRDGVRLWGTADGKAAGLLKPEHPAVSVAFSPRGDLLASGDNVGKIRLWIPPLAGSPATPGPWKAVAALPEVHRGPVRTLAFSPTGAHMASGGDDHQLLLWGEGGSPGSPVGVSLEVGREVQAVAFSPDSGSIVVAHPSGLRELGAERAGATAPVEGWGRSLASTLAPGASHLVSITQAGRLVLRDGTTGDPLPLPEPAAAPAQGARFQSAAFSPDGQRLAAGDTDGSVRLWDLSARPVRAMPGLPGEPDAAAAGPGVTALAFSHDGSLLAAGSEGGAITVWSVAERRRLESLEGGTRITGLAFRPAGRLLAGANSDGMIRLWDAAAPAEPEELRIPGRSYMRSGGDVVAFSVDTLAFSPDGTLLAFGGADGDVYLYDVATRLPLGAPLKGHSDAVTSLAFDPGSRALASGSKDRTVRRWNLSPEAWLALACRSAGRNLTRAEWKRFVGGAYRRTCPDFPPGEEVSE